MKYPIPEIPDDSENKLGTNWVLPKIIGSGIGYPSGTDQGTRSPIELYWTANKVTNRAVLDS